MMKKVIRKIKMITYIFCLLQIAILLVRNGVANASFSTGDDLINSASSTVSTWESNGESKAANLGIDTNTLLSPVLTIAQVFSFVGFFVVVGAALFLALKWLFASNRSAEGLEKVKKQTFGLAIAAAILLGAWKIWSVLLNGLDAIV